MTQNEFLKAYAAARRELHFKREVLKDGRIRWLDDERKLLMCPITLVYLHQTGKKVGTYLQSGWAGRQLGLSDPAIIKIMDAADGLGHNKLRRHL